MERLDLLAKQLTAQPVHIAPSPVNKFAHVTMAPPDPILGTSVAFRKDPNDKKMNLGVGAYRTDEGKPYVFQAVQEAERRILADKALNKEYLPIEGLESYNTLARDLILGQGHPAVVQGRVASAQTISGTGSLRVGFSFIRTHLGPRKIYFSKPTWGNHLTIAEKSGLEVAEYPYWDEAARWLNLDGMLRALSQAPAGSVIVLHACAHNPTGVDPTLQEWERIADVMAQQDLIPYFDSAYQGFASGDLDHDAAAIRLFISRGFQLFISQSFAKNFGLYGERIGALHIVLSDQATADKVQSQVLLEIRPMYSNPPLHGALIVQKVLSDPALTASWKQELREVSQRIIAMRTSLRSELERLQTPGDWSHVTKQIGMFSYTGLTPAQCERLISTWHIYLLKNGRISMAGINTSNVQYLARAIKDAVSQG